MHFVMPCHEEAMKITLRWRFFPILRAVVHCFGTHRPLRCFFLIFFLLACVSFVVVYFPSRVVEKKLWCLNHFMPQHSTAIKPSTRQLAVRYEMFILSLSPSFSRFFLSCLCASRMPWPAGFISFVGFFFCSGELLGTATKKIGGHCCWWQGLGLPFVSVCVAFTGCAPNHGITFCFAPPPPAAAAATVAVCVLKIKVCTTKVIPIHRRRCCSPEGGCVFFSVFPLCFVVLGLFPTAFPNHPLYFSSAIFFPSCLTMHCLTIVLIWKLFIKHAAGCARLFPLHILFFWYKAEKS